jgi:hypothetical protein
MPPTASRQSASKDTSSKTRHGAVYLLDEQASSTEVDPERLFTQAVLRSSVFREQVPLDEQHQLTALAIIRLASIGEREEVGEDGEDAGAGRRVAANRPPTYCQSPHLQASTCKPAYSRRPT